MGVETDDEGSCATSFAVLANEKADMQITDSSRKSNRWSVGVVRLQFCGWEGVLHIRCFRDSQNKQTATIINKAFKHRGAYSFFSSSWGKYSTDAAVVFVVW